MTNLRPSDFADLFGTKASQLPKECLTLIRTRDFRYTTLAGLNKEKTLAAVMRRIDEDTKVAGKKRKSAWEKGWSENLINFVRKNYSLDELTPKYFRPDQPVRLYGEYALPKNPFFEKDWYDVFSTWLFKKYAAPYDHVYEFGCGSGHNLWRIAQLFPEKEVYGLDWAPASVKIANNLAKSYGWKISGKRFDFFSPDKNFKIKKNSVVFTLGALEQTGSHYEPFFQYLLESKPSLCVHVEPIVEWYDSANLVDFAAIRFHRNRGYWTGYPDLLKKYEAKKKLKILKMKRSYFGSLYVEGFSQLIWKPL